jgi:nucleoside-diphosphate-sugar epimerase
VTGIIGVAGGASLPPVRTAFVTGGTGFVGLNLVALLKDRGWKVIAVHRKSSNTKHLQKLGPELLECGLDDPAALGRAMPEGLDAVFHVAGDISWWRGHDERLRGARCHHGRALGRKEPDITAGNARLVCSRWSIDPSKAEKELGFTRVPLRVMVEDSYRWLMDEGLL